MCRSRGRAERCLSVCSGKASHHDLIFCRPWLLLRVHQCGVVGDLMKIRDEVEAQGCSDGCAPPGRGQQVSKAGCRVSPGVHLRARLRPAGCSGHECGGWALTAELDAEDMKPKVSMNLPFSAGGLFSSKFLLLPRGVSSGENVMWKTDFLCTSPLCSHPSSF